MSTPSRPHLGVTIRHTESLALGWVAIGSPLELCSLSPHWIGTCRPPPDPDRFFWFFLPRTVAGRRGPRYSQDVRLAAFRPAAGRPGKAGVASGSATERRHGIGHRAARPLPRREPRRL